MKYTISIDFDGTIVDHAFPEIGALKPGAKEAIIELHKHYTVVISSCRSSALFRNPNPQIAIPDQGAPDGRDYVQEMREFLLDNGIPYHRIDHGDEGKVVALHYIDDRSIRFENNWEEITRKLCKKKKPKLLERLHEATPNMQPRKPKPKKRMTTTR